MLLGAVVLKFDVELDARGLCQIEPSSIQQCFGWAARARNAIQTSANKKRITQSGSCTHSAGALVGGAARGQGEPSQCRGSAHEPNPGGAKLPERRCN